MSWKLPLFVIYLTKKICRLVNSLKVITLHSVWLVLLRTHLFKYSFPRLIITWPSAYSVFSCSHCFSGFPVGTRCLPCLLNGFSFRTHKTETAISERNICLVSDEDLPIPWLIQRGDGCILWCICYVHESFMVEVDVINGSRCFIICHVKIPF